MEIKTKYEVGDVAYTLNWKTMCVDKVEIKSLDSIIFNMSENPYIWYRDIHNNLYEEDCLSKTKEEATNLYHKLKIRKNEKKDLYFCNKC